MSTLNLTTYKTQLEDEVQQVENQLHDIEKNALEKEIGAELDKNNLQTQIGHQLEADNFTPQGLGLQNVTYPDVKQLSDEDMWTLLNEMYKVNLKY